jgi:hypothetical protein
LRGRAPFRCDGQDRTGLEASPFPANCNVFRHHEIFVDIRLLGSLQFVVPVKDFVDPQSNEFAAQAAEVEEYSTGAIGPFGGRDTIFVVTSEMGSGYWP